MWLDKSRAPTPIFVDEDQFNSGSRRGGLYKICGIAEDAQEAIRSLQPYLHGDAAESQSLWLLQQMSNIDKHRYLNLSVIGRYPGMSFFVDPNVEITAVSSPDDRTVVARAHPRTPDAEITDPLILPQVVLEDLPLEDWRPLDVQVGMFVRLVSEIVEDLSARFLPATGVP
jgi:hypothetical protein